MRKSIFLVVLLLVAGSAGLHAQSLQNTSWKMYLDALNDTLVLHIGKDSSFTSNSKGEVFVRSACRVAKDTIGLRDVDGVYSCPNGEGVYKFTIEEGTLNFFLVSDPCDNRSNAINGSKWIKVP